MKARSRSSSIQKKPSSRARKSQSASTQSAKEEPRQAWTRATVLAELKTIGDPEVRAKMSYFGINASKAHGISAPVLHAFARHIGKNQDLAEELWSSGVHEAKILAALLGEAHKITAAQMEKWVCDFDSWDVVDSACCYLYAAAEPAWKKIHEWSTRTAEYEKRAAFSLAAYLSYKDRAASDAQFEKFLRIIEREAYDDRNFVRKAVNWALRNIGKRNLRLNKSAIASAERIRLQNSRSARWIAADALRELRSDAVQKRLRRKTPSK
jgi:3-methyladenine DNA glycosylase AlkD